MIRLSCSLIALALGVTAAQAGARDAAKPAAAPPQVAQSQQNTNETTATAFLVTDREVDQFAQAVVKLKKIEADRSLDEDSKQDQMAATVVAIGLDPGRYNQIGEHCSTDSDLRARVETALAKYADPGPDVV